MLPPRFFFSLASGSQSSGVGIFGLTSELHVPAAVGIAEVVLFVSSAPMILVLGSQSDWFFASLLHEHRPDPVQVFG
jgi:hypothetical protein